MGAGGTLDGVSSPHSAFSKVAGKSFSVFNRFGPNLEHLLGVPEEDRELTGAGSTLDGVSSPHSSFSKVAGKSFSVFNRFGPYLEHLLGVPPRRGPPTNFEENPTTLSGLHRLKAKMTRKNLTDVDQIYRIFVSMYYTRFTKIWRESKQQWERYKELCVHLYNHVCGLRKNSCWVSLGSVVTGLTPPSHPPAPPTHINYSNQI